MVEAAGVNQRCICASDELVDGGRGVCFVVNRNDVSEAAFAVRFRGRVHAYLNRCAHLAVELDWQPGEFFDVSGLYLICATHGALYDPESGRCLGGSCNGEGLRAVSVIEDCGRVFLIEEGENSVGRQ
jgi:nitrite reductase/ring-hydroxylating ferredoxin subunit